MKKAIFLLLATMLSFVSLSSFLFENIFTTPPNGSYQGFPGAWVLVEKNGKPFQDGKMVKIISGSHFVYTLYNDKTGEFLGTEGGTYTIQDDKIQEVLEFCTWNPENVGNNYTFSFNLDGDKMNMEGKVDGESITEEWKRIDWGGDAKETPLAGAWRIREREVDGEMQTMKVGPRKTIKILSGSRFQWTAFNSATKEFMGCGGGTYSAEDGTYTEHIEYFSRDASRVGMQLSFSFQRKGDDWHHSGKSSKGDPIYEIWTLND